MPTPEIIFCPDTGSIPNSRLPVLLYRAVVPVSHNAGDWLEQTFIRNNWPNNWRDTILPYHHYHSTTHEVIGVYSGSATIQLGGEHGPERTVTVGDVLVLPAGVGHKNVRQTDTFRAVGGYPDGRAWDLLRGLPNERPRADQTIATVPLPKTDPLFGELGPLISLWHNT